LEIYGFQPTEELGRTNGQASRPQVAVVLFADGMGLLVQGDHLDQ